LDHCRADILLTRIIESIVEGVEEKLSRYWGNKIYKQPTLMSACSCSQSIYPYRGKSFSDRRKKLEHNTSLTTSHSKSSVFTKRFFVKLHLYRTK